MTERLTTDQLNQIVAEVGNLQASREAEIAPEQVKEILNELGLAPHLVDEALVQIQRRQVLQVQQQRLRRIAIGVIAAVAIAITGTVFYYQQRDSTLAQVSTQGDRITLNPNDGDDLKNISRQDSAEIFYRVTLKDTPVGQRLDLICNWIDPNGEIVQQNRYQTRKIDTPIWNTHCRHRIGSASTPGQWKVQMFLADRQLSETEFEVK